MNTSHISVFGHTIAFALAGCLIGPGVLYLTLGTPQEFADKVAQAQPSTVNPQVDLFVDKGTGCEYLVAGSSITPRLDALGYPVCPGPAEEGVEPLLPPEWKGGDAESPIYDDPMDQPLTDGMEIPGFIWDDQTQMWVRPAADDVEDVEDTATLARPGPVFTL